MKFFPLVAALALPGLNSCQLSSEKAKEEAENGSIPPPKNQLVSDNSLQEPIQPELPELTLSGEQNEAPKKEVDVIKMGDFEFKNVLETLPTQRDLASPPAPVIPAPPEKENKSAIDDEITKPLVTNS